MSALVRNTDPETSHEAANDFSEITLTIIQADVFEWFKEHKKGTDEWLIAGLKNEYPGDGTVRKRRHELVQKGLVKDTGEREKSNRGKNMIVGGLVENVD